MENYAAIKERLVAGSDNAIVGVDDDWCRAIADRLEAQGTSVTRISAAGSVDEGYFAQGSALLEARNGEVRPVISLSGVGSLRGRHNAQNALAALGRLCSGGIVS